MSVLSNERAKAGLGIRFTPVRETLARVVAALLAEPPRAVAGRAQEIAFAASLPGPPRGA
jgi:hypothetical protein